MKKILSNAFIHLSGRLFGVFVVLLTTRILSSNLGANNFGRYSTPDYYLWVFATFLDLGLYLILVRKLSLSKSKQEQETVMSNFLGIRIFAASVSYFIAIVLSFFTKYDEQIITSIVFLSFGHLFVDINQLICAKFQSDLELWKLVLGETIGRIATLILTFVGIKNSLSIPILIFFTVLGDFLNLITSYIFVSKKISIMLSFDIKEWKKIFFEALPLGVSMMFILAYNRVSVTILSLVEGKEGRSVGVFGPAFRIVEFAGIVPQIFMGTIFPELSKKDIKSLKKILVSSLFSFFFLALFGSIMTQFFSSQIISILTEGNKDFVSKDIFRLFKKDFEIFGSKSVLNILIFSTIFSYPVSVMNYILVSRGAQKYVTFPSFVGFLTSLVSSIFLIPKLSYLGAVISSIITNFFVLLFCILSIVFYLKREEENKVKYEKT